MLHIKDIEAFASINEALARNSKSASKNAPATPPHTRRAASGQVVPFPAKEREEESEGADTLGGAGYDFDLVPSRAPNMATLFTRMFFGRR
ncbi:hypothetical protein [Azospirillum sp.]|uniref:hypothetical protein n=1 Tax=Azospirillum sp. TaxID=34012 RepID=UPI002D4BFBD2|nr:hypothetical protein [Azospirillum sp.]HYD70641.1 hypothetical protein [Azospirillum sp.]